MKRFIDEDLETVIEGFIKKAPLFGELINLISESIKDGEVISHHSMYGFQGYITHPDNFSQEEKALMEERNIDFSGADSARYLVGLRINHGQGYDGSVKEVSLKIESPYTDLIMWGKLTNSIFITIKSGFFGGMKASYKLSAILKPGLERTVNDYLSKFNVKLSVRQKIYNSLSHRAPKWIKFLSMYIS